MHSCSRTMTSKKGCGVLEDQRRGRAVAAKESLVVVMVVERAPEATEGHALMEREVLVARLTIDGVEEASVTTLEGDIEHVHDGRIDLVLPIFNGPIIKELRLNRLRSGLEGPNY
ncbi:hypothetical protein Cni_G02827 [Canna indica]|uniref:Uncharacterized protein n=1 Tax=Canna indica TaxID=4628 RepID=A0AAQ3Q0F0_9LILI|nr:hypothetical protein Cni_G02827 [Canna indica]